MRRSGARGGDGWMVAIPVLALLVAVCLWAGGPAASLLTLNNVVRDLVIGTLAFVKKLL